jgi:2-keto-4-pentenoate hydratase/2-oxohepta-3-ene-1,7-dioic acid hydratase in catechol pathway
MKLLTYQGKNGGEKHFGILIEDKVVSFPTLQKLAQRDFPDLSDCLTYCKSLPYSMEHAKELQDFAISHQSELASYSQPLSSVKILPPLYPPAMFDFGLTPRHLANSAITLLKHEFGKPIAVMLAPFLKSRFKKLTNLSALPYYKCNHNAVIGDGDEINWPAYTSYLDIEPELAVVIGNDAMEIAGYTIFNDASARDVQFWEMLGSGPTRSKDFDRSNGLGPFLVTPDELGDPLSLEVKAKIGERYLWTGSTSEYIRTPSEVVNYLKTILTPPAGTVLGMGTVPGCTGLDNDLWVNPGETIVISFDKLGELHQQIPSHLPPLLPTRWKKRKELEEFYKN